MDAECRDLFNEIERRKQRIIQSVERLHTGAQMAKQPGRDWSPNMVIEHLVKAEEAQLKEIAHGQVCRFEALKKTKNLTKKGVLFVLRKGIRVKANPTMVPTGHVPTEELVKRWNAAREKLKQSLESVEPDEPISKHPQMGWLTARDLLTITDAHLHYHERDFMQKA